MGRFQSQQRIEGACSHRLILSSETYHQNPGADLKARIDTSQISVLAPNFKRRLSGVTATIVRLVPIQAKVINLAAVGPGLPESLPHLSIWSVLAMSRRGPGGGSRVWHARRNTEMLFGLFLVHVLRKRLKLVFTSASQREHSRYTKGLIRRMDFVIATSARTDAYLERPARVILHGIDVEKFTPARDKATLRKSLGLPSDSILVGCYGRIRAQKGTDAFVEAMCRILPGQPEVTALVMGRATDKHAGFLEELKQSVTRAGLADRILFLPEVTVDLMPDWYRVLDLFVAPQRWEGFGLTPLEAMACGVPVVATTVGAFPELVQDGQTGTLVEPDDIDAIADAASDWLGDEERRRKAALAARQHMDSSFRIEREAMAIVDVYRELLDRDAP